MILRSKVYWKMQLFRDAVSCLEAKRHKRRNAREETENLSFKKPCEDKRRIFMQKSCQETTLTDTEALFVFIMFENCQKKVSFLNCERSELISLFEFTRQNEKKKSFDLLQFYPHFDPFFCS